MSPPAHGLQHEESHALAIGHFPLKLSARRMLAPTVAHLTFVRDDGQRPAGVAEFVQCGPEPRVVHWLLGGGDGRPGQGDGDKGGESGVAWHDNLGFQRATKGPA